MENWFPWENTCDEAVDILASGALPGVVRIVEIGINIDQLSQFDVPGYFLALVMGQRFAQKRREVAREIRTALLNGHL